MQKDYVKAYTETNKLASELKREAAPSKPICSQFKIIEIEDSEIFDRYWEQSAYDEWRQDDYQSRYNDWKTEQKERPF